MANLVQLENHTRELAAAINSLVTCCQTTDRFLATANDMKGRPSPLEITPDVSEEAHQARESALATLSKLQIMLAGPSDFLQQMSSQTQLLASIQWLGEFQVPACVPLDGCASIQDISDLISVPETQLCRMIRMAATAGFLQEPRPGYVSHSALSAAFVIKPSYLDAAMFLAETAVPAALDMTAMTKQGSARPSHSDNSDMGNGNGPLNSSHPNPTNRYSQATDPRLQRLHRQWYAYLRHGTGYLCDTATDIMFCLQPLRFASVTIVEAGARSPERAIALSKRYPTLNFMVQLESRHAPLSGSLNPDQLSGHPGIKVSYREPGTPQPIQNASIYIINFPLPVLGLPRNSLTTQLTAELRIHLAVLRRNSSATIVLTVPPLLERGPANMEPAVLPQVRDLLLLQLTNERELEMSDLISLVHGISDRHGRLVLVNKVRSMASHGAMALEIKYQEYTSSPL